MQTEQEKAQAAAARMVERERLRFSAAAEVAKLGARNPGTPLSILCGDLLKAIANTNPWSARDVAGTMVRDELCERRGLEHVANWLKVCGIGKDSNERGAG